MVTGNLVQHLLIPSFQAGQEHILRQHGKTHLYPIKLPCLARFVQQSVDTLVLIESPISLVPIATIFCVVCIAEVPNDYRGAGTAFSQAPLREVTCPHGTFTFIKTRPFASL